MTCWNCGNEIVGEQKFCSFCGADLQGGPAPEQPEQPAYEAPSAPEQPQYYAPPGDAPKKDMSIFFKIFGIICAVCYGIAAIAKVFSVFSGLGIMFRGFFALGLFNVIFALLLVVAGAFMCVVSIMIALRRSPETADGLAVAFLGGLVVRIVLRLLQLIVATIIIKITYHYGSVSFLPILWMLLLAILAGGVYIGLCAAEGGMPIVGKTKEEIQASITAAIDSLKKGASEAGAKASATAERAKVAAENAERPAGAAYGVPLKTDRSLLMYILLSLVTCGIYSYWFIYKMAQDVNTACEGDGKSTSGLLAFILLSFVTCGFYALYWEYSLANRLAENAPRYGLNFQENGTNVLLWYLFGAIICGIGPYIAMNILMKNTNAICAAYNQQNNLY